MTFRETTTISSWFAMITFTTTTSMQNFGMDQNTAPTLTSLIALPSWELRPPMEETWWWTISLSNWILMSPPLIQEDRFTPSRISKLQPSCSIFTSFRWSRPSPTPWLPTTKISWRWWPRSWAITHPSAYASPWCCCCSYGTWNDAILKSKGRRTFFWHFLLTSWNPSLFFTSTTKRTMLTIDHHNLIIILFSFYLIIFWKS